MNLAQLTKLTEIITAITPLVGMATLLVVLCLIYRDITKGGQ